MSTKILGRMIKVPAIPSMLIKLQKSVTKGESEKGIIICGTGISVSIVANKQRGIRCALLSDVFSANMRII